jgi:hypothetical protein
MKFPLLLDYVKLRNCNYYNEIISLYCVDDKIADGTIGSYFGNFYFDGDLNIFFQKWPPILAS